MGKSFPRSNLKTGIQREAQARTLWVGNCSCPGFSKQKRVAEVFTLECAWGVLEQLELHINWKFGIWAAGSLLFQWLLQCCAP